MKNSKKSTRKEAKKDLSKLGKNELMDIISAQSREIDMMRGEQMDLDELEEEEKTSYRRRLKGSILSTTNILIVVAAVSLLVAMLWLPVLRIYGESMSETLKNGDLVVSAKGAKFETGDIIAFYYNNNILVKRVIAGPGDWVDIDVDGNVSVNQELLDEPYLTEKAFGEPDIDLPYQVPDERYFVLGDKRSVSIDSRYRSVGCVTTEQVVGKLVFRIWPLSRLGALR